MVTTTNWLNKQLTCRERALRAIRGEPIDRPAAVNPTSNINITLMDEVDAPFPFAHREPDKMARLAATGHTVLGYDTIMPAFSIIQETAALGLNIDWMEKDNWATCRGIYAQKADDIKFPKDWIKNETSACLLNAIKSLRREYPDVCIIGKTMGPWTMGYHYFGTENFLLMSYDDPDEIKRALDVLKQTTIEFGMAQIDAGADALTLPDHATGDLVNGEYYSEFLKELHQELADIFPCPIILHICGRTVDRMEAIGETGFAAFHFDSKNLPDESMETIGKNCRLVGNVNNPMVLYRGKSEQAYAEAIRCMNHGVMAVGPECAVPLVTPNETLQAISKACRDYPNLTAAEKQDWENRCYVYNLQGQIAE